MLNRLSEWWYGNGNKAAPVVVVENKTSEQNDKLDKTSSIPSSSSSIHAGLKEKSKKDSKEEDQSTSSSNNSDPLTATPILKATDTDILGTLQNEIQNLESELQAEQQTWETLSDKYLAMGVYPENVTPQETLPKPKPTWVKEIEGLAEQAANHIWETMKEMLVPHTALEGLIKHAQFHIEKKKKEREEDYAKFAKKDSQLTEDDKNKLLSHMCLKNCEMIALLTILLNQANQLILSCLKFDATLGSAVNAAENFIITALGIALFKIDVTTFINNCKSNTDNEDLKQYRDTLANKLELPIARMHAAVGAVKGDLLKFQEWLTTCKNAPSQNPAVALTFAHTPEQLQSPTPQNVVQHFASLKT